MARRLGGLRFCGRRRGKVATQLRLQHGQLSGVGTAVRLGPRFVRQPTKRHGRRGLILDGRFGLHFLVGQDRFRLTPADGRAPAADRRGRLKVASGETASRRPVCQALVRCDRRRLELPGPHADLWGGNSAIIPISRRKIPSPNACLRQNAPFFAEGIIAPTAILRQRQKKGGLHSFRERTAFRVVPLASRGVQVEKPIRPAATAEGAVGSWGWDAVDATEQTAGERPLGVPVTLRAVGRRQSFAVSQPPAAVRGAGRLAPLGRAPAVGSTSCRPHGLKNRSENTFNSLE